MALELEKIAVRARCTKSHCKFNGVILVPRTKPKKENLKKENCPFCYTVGYLVEDTKPRLTRLAVHLFALGLIIFMASAVFKGMFCSHSVLASTSGCTRFFDMLTSEIVAGFVIGAIGLMIGSYFLNKCQSHTMPKMRQ